MTENILDKIVTHKKQEVRDASHKRPLISLQAELTSERSRRSFFDRLAQCPAGGVNIIAEIKRASPSKGLIRPNLDPADYARKYESGGAAALSVLTDRTFFKGSADDLITARRAANLPVLRKDFIVSEYQIYESAVIGADALLLIAAALSQQQLEDYLALTGDLNLDALVEIHSAKEHQIATRAGAKLIGINNRNLKTFQTSIETSISMAPQLADHQVGVAESGIRTPDDIAAVRRAGIYNFLIGESLVRADSPRLLLQSFINRQSTDRPGEEESGKVSSA